MCQAFSIVELSRLVVVKDLDDIADLLVVEMKLSCFFIVYDWHILTLPSYLSCQLCCDLIDFSSLRAKIFLS